ncbi:heat shock 70 kDa protein 16 [Hordeum vulgare]|nr:heat shock 70 kDa protein 16 [Hordeum vulgare]
MGAAPGITSRAALTRLELHVWGAVGWRGRIRLESADVGGWHGRWRGAASSWRGEAAKAGGPRRWGAVGHAVAGGCRGADAGGHRTWCAGGWRGRIRLGLRVGLTGSLGSPAVRSCSSQKICLEFRDGFGCIWRHEITPCSSIFSRRAYADAAVVAGLRPLRLMHDLAATALCYGLYRSDLGVAGKPTFVAFVDVGHSDTQAGVVAFDPSGMKVLSHAFDADLGGTSRPRHR